MSEKREFYAATVEDAVEKAAAELGVSSDLLEYSVLDEGNSGFLGIGARDARIVIEAPEMANGPREPETGLTERYEAEAQHFEAEDPDEEEPSEQLKVFGHVAEEEPVASVPEGVIKETEGHVVALLEAMGFTSQVDVYDAGGYVAVDVAPDNTGLFIGQKGETIDALQYLVNSAVNRNRSERTRIVLDAEGYRQRRVEAIQGMAHRTARRALRERRTVELPPMNPSERRVVHLFLRDNPRVTTESQGTGEDRRVRVSPA